MRLHVAAGQLMAVHSFVLLGGVPAMAHCVFKEWRVIDHAVCNEPACQGQQQEHALVGVPACAGRCACMANFPPAHGRVPGCVHVHVAMCV